VRIARDLGDVSLILPPACKTLADAPYSFAHALKAALRFLSFEEMMPDDVPPRNIWLDGRRLKEHFADLRAKHREGGRRDEIEDPQRNGAIDMLITGG
jgi:hypothetical protein